MYRPKDFTTLRDHFVAGYDTFYNDIKVNEIKGNKIRLEGDNDFFTPWIPAIKIDKE